MAGHKSIYSPDGAKDFHYYSDSKLMKSGGAMMTQWYGQAHDDRVSLHAAINYGWSHRAMKTISSHHPSARYILVLRNPADRAISAYRYFSELGVETRSFSEALQCESSRDLTDQQKHYGRYLGQGNYADLLRQVHEYVDSDQLLVLTQPECKTNLDDVKMRLGNHLSIDPSSFGPYDTLVNQSKQARATWLNQLFQSKEGTIGWWKKNVPMQRMLPQSSRKALGDKVRSWNQSKNSTSLTLSEELQRHLQVYADDMIDQLEAYSKQDYQSLRKSHYLTSL